MNIEKMREVLVNALKLELIGKSFEGQGVVTTNGVSWKLRESGFVSVNGRRNRTIVASNPSVIIDVDLELENRNISDYEAGLDIDYTSFKVFVLLKDYQRPKGKKKKDTWVEYFL